MFDSRQLLAKRERRNCKPGEAVGLNWTGLWVSIYREIWSHSDEKMNVENKEAQNAVVRGCWEGRMRAPPQEQLAGQGRAGLGRPQCPGAHGHRRQRRARSLLQLSLLSRLVSQASSLRAFPHRRCPVATASRGWVPRVPFSSPALALVNTTKWVVCTIQLLLKIVF